MIKRQKVLIKKNSHDAGSYICYSPSIALIEVGEDLDAIVNNAFAQLESVERKDKFFTPALMVHLKRLCAVSLFLLFVMLTGSHLYRQLIDYRTLRLKHQVISTFNASPERQALRIERFKKKVKKLRPYINEVRDLLD